jgi:hypothetical protein
MARQPHHPLRALSDQERECLLSISRSYHEPAAHVARAKALVMRNYFVPAPHCLLCTLLLASNAFRSLRHATRCNGAARVSP